MMYRQVLLLQSKDGNWSNLNGTDPVWISKFKPKLGKGFGSVTPLTPIHPSFISLYNTWKTL